MSPLFDNLSITCAMRHVESFHNVIKAVCKSGTTQVIAMNSKLQIIRIINYIIILFNLHTIVFRKIYLRRLFNKMAGEPVPTFGILRNWSK
jgi:hypothetical protein